MAAIGGGEKVNLTAPDIAAALAPKEGRAPIMNKDLADVQKRMIKMGGKSVFEADTSQSEDDAMVNFDEMRRVMDDEQKRVAAETDPVRKADMQKRQDRLMRRFSVYDKLLNNEGLGAMTAEEQREMMGVMADLPGFCESIAIATNNTLTIEQARKIMMGKGGVGLTPDQKKVIGEMVTQFANDDKLHARLAKSLTKLKLSDDDSDKVKKILDLQKGLGDEVSKQNLLDGYNQRIGEFESLSPKDQARITQTSDKIVLWLNNVSDQYKPADYTEAAIDGKIAKINTLIAAENAKKVGAPNPVQLAIDGRVTALENQINWLDSTKGIITAGGFNKDEYTKYVDYKEAKQKRDTTKTELDQIQEKRTQIATLESQRNKDAGQYKRRLEIALSNEMKRYWNEVKLVQADQAAQAEAAKKAEIEAKDKEAKAKRETLAKTVLDKYLHLSFLKYKGGKAVGWCDNDLKKFVKTDMLARSPAQLTRDLLERVNTMRYNMPPAYAKEMKKMWDDAGIGMGTPPLTLKAALDEIGKDKWEEWAAEKIPDVLGYAYGRGYYFDRLRIKAGQAEFMRQAYSPEFFTKALEAKSKYAGAADEMVKSGLLTGGAVNEAKLKEMLGGDWVQGSKRVMKTLAVAGAIGAGTFVLGGGLMTNLTPGAPFTYNLGAGLNNVGTNLNHLKDAALQTAALASRTSGKVIEGASTFVANNANQILNP